MTKTNKKTIRALERGIAVLDIINKIGPTSLKSIYEESTLPRPTLLRILHTLEQTGLIRRGLGDGLYRPTFKLEKSIAVLWFRIYIFLEEFMEQRKI